MQPELAAIPFPDRFRVERKLGSGGFGVVYEAFDQKRNARVAIKTLSHIDPAGLYSLKREFRSLAGLVHPNLATLFELFTSAEQCFLTMEPVDGIDFVAALRPEAEKAAAAAIGADDSTLTLARPAALPRSVSDWQRLRGAMLQLTQGLAAIHDGGHLHRDIKPSNVLVEQGGRVVILDFGLVASSDPTNRDDELAGTPRYMGPEQAAGMPCEASDWYSAGIMLHECLTGHAPNRHEQALFAPDSDAPPDLRDICLRMISAEPARRPARHELLSVFSGGRAEPPPVIPRRRFVGRAADLQMLQAALAATSNGRAYVARVRGESGIGKSALCLEFERIIGSQRESALVFHSRCHDRESVRYKAIDGVVDGISAFLAGLSNLQVERYLPRDIAPLTRVFPVLNRVPAVLGAQHRGAGTNDPQELRRRAFAALRELLGRLAASQPVVIFVDDLQWSDLDSVPVLEAILREPDSPGILLTAAWRADEESNAALDLLLPVLRGGQGCEITLGDLPPEDALELARSLSPTSLAPDIVRQAGGNPFLIDAYLRHSLDAGPHQPLDIDSVIEAQIERLPEAARPLLELLSLAGRALPAEMFPGGAGPRLHELLLAERLVRSRVGEGLELYHDRVRSAIANRLPAERRRECHLWLAHVFAALPSIEPEAVAQQFHAGGDAASAARFAEPAADLALGAFAYNRAVALYRMALANPKIEPDRKGALLHRLGDAYTGAGMAFRAAEAYRSAAELVPPAERTDLLRMAGERFLVGGHMDEGTETMAIVARSVGITMPRTARAALISMLARRAWLHVRGMGFRRTAAESVPAHQLQRIDVCASLVSGFASVDPFRAFDFQARVMLYALRAGEPVRIARALAIQAPTMGSAGTRNWEATMRTLRLAESLLESTGDPVARHSLATTSASAYFFIGHWEEATRRLILADAVMAPEGSGSAWVNSTKVSFRVVSLLYLGEIAAVRERLADDMADARGRGNLNVETTLIIRCGSYLLLASDDPETARTQVRTAIARWSQQGYFFHHFWTMLAETDAALYCGEVRQAWDRLEAEWPLLRGAHLFEVQLVAIESRHMRARTALALAAMEPASRKRLLAKAMDEVRKIESEKAEWGVALALLLRAGVARLESTGEAGAIAHQSVASLRAAGMKIHAAAALRRAGEWNGEPAGVAEADAIMRAQGILNPERYTAMLAPPG